MSPSAILGSLLAGAAVVALLGPPAAAGEGDVLVDRRDQARRAFLASPRGMYGHYCAHCHGEKGKGDGRLWASELSPKPADLTALDEDKSYLIEAIRDGSGVHGKSDLCPPWGRTISPQNVDRLARHLLSLGPETEPAPAETRAGGSTRESFPWFLVVVLALEAIVLLGMQVKRMRGAGASAG